MSWPKNSGGNTYVDRPELQKEGDGIRFACTRDATVQRGIMVSGYRASAKSQQIRDTARGNFMNEKVSRNFTSEMLRGTRLMYSQENRPDKLS